MCVCVSVYVCTCAYECAYVSDCLSCMCIHTYLYINSSYHGTITKDLGTTANHNPAKLYSHLNGTAHNRACVQHGLEMTHCSFYMHASTCVHAVLMTSNLLFRALMHVLEVCYDSSEMHACISGMYTANMDCMYYGVHLNCKPRPVA